MLYILYHFPSTVMGSELLLCHAMVHHHELLGGAQSETKCLGCLLIGSDGLFSSFPGGGQQCHIISKLALSDEVMVGSSSAPPESYWSNLQNTLVLTPPISHTLSSHLSITTQAYRLNRVGARVQPYLKPSFTLILSNSSSSIRILASTLWWTLLMIFNHPFWHT